MDASKPIPISLNRFIRLSLDDQLSKREKAMWFKIVERFNIIEPTKVIVPKKEPMTAVLFHKKINEKHIYEIPLKRDLTETEVKNIIEQWDNYFKIKDFIVEASQGDMEKQRKLLSDAIIIKDESYDHLCEAISQSQHRMWMEERIKNGWRYGERVNEKEKTHPMIKEWHQLPEKYKKVDFDTPQVFLEELKKLGFTVVKTAELNTLIESF